VSAAVANVGNLDAQKLFIEPLVAAAVLVPVIEHDVPTLLFTRRPEHLRSHPGQVSFPGGRVEEIDQGPADTALRETREETGIAEDSVEIAGYLSPHAVLSGFAITPVVGFVRPGFRLTIDPVEVAEVFEVPVSFFLDHRNAVVTEREWRGVRMQMCEYHFDNHRIWGATAQIIESFCEALYNN
jgi:8-oxo-dGTP pyrophosphatase MutT (NUDIX family)